MLLEFTYDFDAVSLPFEVRCLLSHGGARVIGIVRTMWSSDQWRHSWSPITFYQFAVC